MRLDNDWNEAWRTSNIDFEEAQDFLMFGIFSIPDIGGIKVMHDSQIKEEEFYTLWSKSTLKIKTKKSLKVSTWIVKHWAHKLF